MALLLLASSLSAQTPLQDEIRKIAADARGKVSVACLLSRPELNCDLEAHSRPPMQSVFKLPLAVYALHLVEAGKFTLGQPIRFLPNDRILPHTHSPLRTSIRTGTWTFCCVNSCALLFRRATMWRQTSCCGTWAGLATLPATLHRSERRVFTWKTVNGAWLAMFRFNIATGLSQQERCNCFAASATTLRRRPSTRGFC